jgi:hypothetical protein
MPFLKLSKEEAHLPGSSPFALFIGAGFVLSVRANIFRDHDSECLGVKLYTGRKLPVTNEICQEKAVTLSPSGFSPLFGEER